MYRIHAIGFAALLGLVACEEATSSMNVKTTSAEVSTLTGRETYTFAVAQYAPEGYDRPVVREDLMGKVKSDIDAVMQSKGYTKAPDAQLVIRISSGTRTIEKPPAGHRGPASPAINDTEGALVVDILELSGKQVFHGYARDVLTEDKVDDKQLADAVKKLLEPVPGRQP